MQVSSATLSFIRLVRKTRFGTIRNFRLCQGEPCVDANTEVSVEYRLSGSEQKPDQVTDDDYLNKPQVKTMLRQFIAVGDGLVEMLDVRDSLPFKMVVRKRAIM